MSSSADIAPHPVVAQLRAVADALLELPLWRMSAADEAHVLAEIETERRRVEYGWLRVLADFDARGVSIEEAGLSTRAFLGLRLHLSPSDATSRLRIAAELAESTAPSGESIPAALQATSAAAATGEISPEHVRVIDRAVRKLPVGIAPELRTEAEAALAKHARELDPSALTLVARRIHQTLDPDGMLDADLPARRELAFVRDVGGCDLLRGRLDAEGAAIVRTAVDAISAPQAQDARTPTRRRADGLIELCRRYLDSGLLPTQAGEKPHITVTMDLADLTARLATNQPIPAESARRLSCDATVIPAVLGAKGEPLDVGRATRTIPPGIRRALVIRDKGCIHPGCPKPAAWCDAHHVRHWSAGGPTALPNLVLLCAEHHWIVHHTEWRIAFLQGIPHLIPPLLIDRDQKPLRNTLHDTS